jgi:PAS domain S-box-containing protein
MFEIPVGNETMASQIDAKEIISNGDYLGIAFRVTKNNKQPPKDQSETLLEIFEYAIIFEDFNEFLHKTAEILCESCDFELVRIVTKDTKHEELLLSDVSADDFANLKAGNSVPFVVVECRRKNSMCQIKHPDDVQVDNSSGEISKHQINIPLCYRGKLLGLLSVESIHCEFFPPEQRAFIKKVAFIIVTAFDKFRSFARTSRSYEYLRSILDSVTDLAILSTDSLGYIVTANSGVESVFQLSPKSVLGRDILTLFTDAEFQRNLALYIASGDESMFAGNSLKQTIEKGELYLDVSFQKMHKIDNHSIGYICLARDVTPNTIPPQNQDLNET